MEKQTVLTEASFYILVSLHDPMHGYGIMQHVEKVSGGTVVLGPGTLYGVIKKFLVKGWIKQYSESAIRNKKEYVITETGKAILEKELRRLRLMVSVGERGGYHEKI